MSTDPCSRSRDILSVLEKLVQSLLAYATADGGVHIISITQTLGEISGNEPDATAIDAAFDNAVATLANPDGASLTTLAWVEPREDSVRSTMSFVKVELITEMCSQYLSGASQEQSTCPQHRTMWAGQAPDSSASALRKLRSALPFCIRSPELTTCAEATPSP